MYRILSKVLANRLKDVIGSLVSSYQFTFMRERQLMDCALIASEITNQMNRGQGGVLLKVDFKKAFHSVNWDYLDEILRAMNFGEKLRSLMRACVRSIGLSMLVNGSPTEQFHMK